MTYVKKRRFELEDSKLLQHYNINSTVTEGKEDEYVSMYESLEPLDIIDWKVLGIENKENVLSDRKIMNVLIDFVIMYEENHLKRSVDVSKAVQKYLSLCELSGLDALEFYKIHIFHTAADLLFDAQVKNSRLWEKLFRLTKNNFNIQAFVVNAMSPEQISFFLKHLQSGGCLVAETDFPLDLFEYTELAKLHVFYQHVSSLQNEEEDIDGYVQDEYGKSLSEVLPPNYSIERFDLILQIFGVLYSREIVIQRMKLVWRSVAHAYLTTTEVKDILNKLVSKDEDVELIEKICKNYDQILIFPTMMPRSLKHYARTAIRKFYLFLDNINTLNLPTSLKSYIKLDY